MVARVLVLGGGFAGLSAVHELVRRRRRGAGLRITLVDSCAESVFSPLLPDLISARIRAQSMQFPLRRHCAELDVEFRRERVQQIAPESPAAFTETGRLKADRLILCLGCETHYFDNATCERHALGLKSVEEGLAIHRRAIALAGETAKPHPHFLVIGGGYTGLETASHLAVLVRSARGIPYHRLPEACPITVIEQAPQILGRCPPPIVEWSEHTLRKFGIGVLTGTTVDHMVGPHTAVLSNGRTVRNCLVAWTAGVRPVRPCDTLDTPRVRGRRLEVDSFLRLPGAPHAFAAGDVAGPVPEGADEPLRMGVQFSIAGGRLAAANAVRSLSGEPLEAFDPFDPGYLIPLATGRAAGPIMGVELKGHLPCFLHYALCAARSWGMPNRVAVLSDLLSSLRPPA